MYQVAIDVSGAVFDGRLADAIRGGAQDASWEIAKRGRGMLGIEYIRTFKDPTGYYESQTEAERVSDEVSVIHDNDVIYGPWLEGIGSRNAPVTRFKGYANWRRVTQMLAKAAPVITSEAIADRLRTVD